MSDSGYVKEEGGKSLVSLKIIPRTVSETIYQRSYGLFGRVPYASFSVIFILEGGISYATFSFIWMSAFLFDNASFPALVWIYHKVIHPMHGWETGDEQARGVGTTPHSQTYSVCKSSLMKICRHYMLLSQLEQHIQYCIYHSLSNIYNIVYVAQAVILRTKSPSMTILGPGSYSQLKTHLQIYGALL